MEAVEQLGSQVIATSLDMEALGPPPGAALFHVEHGHLRSWAAGGAD
jgi:hypothetical protein